MSYATYANTDPDILALSFIISLILTIAAYCAVPLLVAYNKKKPTTKKKFRRTCYWSNIGFALVFAVLNGGAFSGAAYLLWTSIFAAVGANILEKRGLIIAPEEKSSTATAVATHTPVADNPSSLTITADMYKYICGECKSLHKTWHKECPTCKALGSLRQGTDEAIRKWNTLSETPEKPRTNVPAAASPKGKKPEPATDALAFLASAFQDASQKAQAIGPVIYENQHPGKADYGLSATNPICSTSLSGTENYLRRLCTKDGKTFTWSSYTSIRAALHGFEDVGQDKYTIYLDGNPYAELYFVPYTGEAEFPPAGLYFSDDDRDWDLEREAIAKDLTVEQLLAMRELERENNEIRLKEQEKKRSQREELELRAQTVKEKYPSFSLEEELKSATFALLAELHFDLMLAYEYSHKDTLFIKKVFPTTSHTTEEYSESYYYNLLCKIESENWKNSTASLDKPHAAIAQEAAARNMSVEHYIEMLNMEREHAEVKWQMDLKDFRKWARQAEEAKKQFPSFDLQAEWGKEEFKTLTRKTNVTVAYEVLHFYEYYTPVQSVQNKPSEAQSEWVVRTTLFCRKCGANLPSDSSFCYMCGTKVITPEDHIRYPS